jgi:superkiller protein 3
MMVRRGARVRSASVVATCLCVGVLTGCNQDRAIAVRTMNQALEENKTGRSGEAIELLKQASKTDGTFGDPPYYLGMLYHQRQGNLKEAEAAFKQAIERDPENAQFYYKLGSVQAELGSHEDAIGSLRKAVELKPDFARAWLRLGRSQVANKAYRDAVDSLMASIKADPQLKVGKDDPGGLAYLDLGDLYLRFDFDERALRVYEDGIRHNPDVARMHQGKGIALLKLKRAAEAESAFVRASELDPGLESAFFNMAVAQKEQGKYDAARKSINNFLNIDRTQDANRRAAAGGLLSEIDAKQAAAASAP